MNFQNFFPLLNLPVTGMRFEATYRCYSVALMGKEHLENGGKIILPPSALDILARLNIQYPMLFELTGSQDRVTHCGVLEFVADEGLCYLPHWMMQQLLLSEGQMLTVRSATLPKGTYCKLQPVDQAFLDLTNPKAVLENALRNWSALTAGDIIVINYNKKNYEINVLEVQPDGPSHAISIVEADVMVDFAASQEQLKKAEQARREQLEKVPPTASATKDKVKEPEKPVQQGPTPVETKFPGTGMRLNGKTAPPPPSSSSPKVAAHSSSSSSSSPTASKPGGLVFGGNSKATANAPATSKHKEPEKKSQEEKKPEVEGKKFVPFSGTGYSLRG